MGVIYSKLVKQARRFNVENRAMRAIERKTAVTAPRHATASKYLAEIIRESPDVREKLDLKDTTLDNYLKDVYVTSTGSMPQIVRDKSLLPQRRDSVTEDEYGFWQPEEVPEGQASLGQILKFLTQRGINGPSYTAEIVAEEYKIDEKTAANVLEYYRPFNVYVPAKDVDKSGLYSLSRMKDSLKKIAASSDKT